MAYGFNDDRSKVEIYSKDESDKKFEDKHMLIHRYKTGSCYIIEYDDHFILNDLAATTADDNDFDSFISGILGDHKLDAVICSHFHYDHSGHPEIVADYCTENTDAFMQMDPTENNAQRSGNYFVYRNNFTNVFPQAVVPENNSVYEYGKIKLRIFNTDPSNKTLYDSTPCNRSDTPLNTASGINNYSLICEYVTPAGSFLYTGDIEGVAEEMNASLVKPVDVCHNPHHVSNFSGYLDFFLKANPSFLETQTGTTSPNIGTRRWTGCLMREMGLGILITGTEPSSLIDIFQHTVHYEGGEFFTFEQSSSSSVYNYMRIISARYYNRDPWYLFRVPSDDPNTDIVPAPTAENIIQILHQYAVVGDYYFEASDSASDGLISYRFLLSLIKESLYYLGMATSTDDYGLKITSGALGYSWDDRALTVYRVNSQSYSGKAKILFIWSNTATNHYNMFVDYQAPHVIYNVDGDQSYANLPESITVEDQYTQQCLIFATDILVAVKSSTKTGYIHVFRSGLFNRRNSQGVFYGSFFNRNVGEIWVANMSSTYVFTAERYDMDGNKLGDLKPFGFEICK